MFRAIILGYLTFLIMLGIQSIAFAFGQKYLGVWIAYSWMEQLSSSYFPLFTAFLIGFGASICEEITFRLFFINFGKKFFKNTLLACLVASVLWGFGHTSYPVFPMWFRGVEVSCIGLFLAFVYLRFGIIPVLVAHYLFDVFWSSAAYLFGHSTPGQFYNSLIVLLLPLGFAIIAYLINQPQIERPLRWRLTKHQLFNLEILKNFLKDKGFWGNKSREEVKKEIISHGWDVAIVDIALEDEKHY